MRKVLGLLLAVILLSVPVLAQDESATTKADNTLDMIYKGLSGGVKAVAELGKKSRGVYGYDIINNSFVIGQEWVIVEYNLFGEDVYPALDMALGYIKTEITEGTTVDNVTINNDYTSAMVTGSVGITHKPEIAISTIIGISNVGSSVWGGVDPDLKTGWGIQGHVNITKIAGIDLTEDTVQAWAIKLGIMLLPVIIDN